ncbi:MAG: hypothetical protein L0G70_08190 [Rubrobacter sp.]|nr:hypothetical protein [Rubrobacter sp.]
MSDELALLTDGLRTEIQRASRGEYPESVVVLLTDDRLPMVQITGSNGMVANKVISYPELLGALDDSSVVESLKNENRRTTKLPQLPEGTLLVDVIEEPAKRSYTVTGYLPPDTYLFCLESHRRSTTVTHEIALPHLVYNAVYDETNSRVEKLSLTLCSPDRGYPERGYPEIEQEGGEEAGEGASGSSGGSGAGLTKDEGPRRSTAGSWQKPTPDTPVYRYPFSNVYQSYQGVLEGVCWPTLGSVKTTLAGIPKKVVRTFLELPNNTDLYGRGFSHNGPQQEYAELLEYVEEGGLPEEYLIPAGMSVQGLHDQQRDLQQGGE